MELYRGLSEQDRPQEWLILDADGIWLGTVEIPDRFRITDIKMDAVLGVWERRAGCRASSGAATDAQLRWPMDVKTECPTSMDEI